MVVTLMAGLHSGEAEAQGEKPEKQNEHHVSSMQGRIKWSNTHLVGVLGQRQEREAEIYVLTFSQIQLKISTQRSKTCNDPRQDQHTENHTVFTVVRLLQTKVTRSH